MESLLCNNLYELSLFSPLLPSHCHAAAAETAARTTGKGRSEEMLGFAIIFIHYEHFNMFLGVKVLPCILNE